MTTATAVPFVNVPPRAQAEEAWRILHELELKLPALYMKTAEIFVQYFGQIEADDRTDNMSQSATAEQWTREELESPVGDDADEIRRLVAEAGDKVEVHIASGCALAKDLTTYAFGFLKGDVPQPSRFIGEVVGRALTRLPEVESFHRQVMEGYVRAYGTVTTLDFYGPDGRKNGREAAAVRRLRREQKFQARHRKAVEAAINEARELVRTVYGELRDQQSQQNPAA